MLLLVMCDGSFDDDDKTAVARAGKVPMVGGCAGCRPFGYSFALAAGTAIFMHISDDTLCTCHPHLLLCCRRGFGRWGSRQQVPKIAFVWVVAS